MGWSVVRTEAQRSHEFVVRLRSLRQSLFSPRLRVTARYRSNERAILHPKTL